MSQDAPAPDEWEAWRVWFAQRFFTPLQGIAAPTWFRHLARNRFRIEPRFIPRAALITISSPVNSLFAAADHRKFGHAIARTPAHAPLFVLGHWRSGTTLLQRLLAMDERFCFPTFYQCLFPRGFLHSEERNSAMWAGLLPRTRIFDNMENGFDSPAEDEFALCSLTGLSPYMGWVFPRRWDDYDRYLTFHDVGVREREEWKKALRYLVRKIEYRRGHGPVVLKSPPHTCRIKILRETFPNAKFLHIHRDPAAVFPSTRKMLLTFLRTTQLQSFSEAEIDERIIATYKRMYDVFFDERSLIPAGQYSEVAYEQLEKDPLGEMERIYGELKLPDFSVTQPAIADYVARVAGYKKNAYRPLPPSIADRIGTQWRRTLDEWGYRQPAAAAS